MPITIFQLDCLLSTFYSFANFRQLNLIVEDMLDIRPWITPDKYRKFPTYSSPIPFLPTLNLHSHSIISAPAFQTKPDATSLGYNK